MGELAVRGPRALDALDQLLANDPRRLRAGRALYTPLCYPDGGTVDDAIVYCLEEGTAYLLVVNAARTAADLAWLREGVAAGGWDPAEVTVEDRSLETALLALQGPRAVRVLRRLGADGRLAALRPFGFLPAVELAGVRCLVARTGYTGEDGFELACPWSQAGAVWDALLEAGRPEGLVPAGLGARDTLRLEAALPLYGHALGPGISPLEAGLGRFVRLQGRRFVGSEALAAALAQGPARELVGLWLEPPHIARAGAGVRAADGEPVGEVTSGTFAPTLGRPVALALCRRGAAPVGATVSVEVRGRWVPAAVVPLPFYRRGAADGAGRPLP